MALHNFKAAVLVILRPCRSWIMKRMAQTMDPLCNGPDRPLLTFGQFTFRELAPKVTEGLFSLCFLHHNPSVSRQAADTSLKVN